MIFYPSLSRETIKQLSNLVATKSLKRLSHHKVLNYFTGEQEKKEMGSGSLPISHCSLMKAFCTQRPKIFNPFTNAFSKTEV